MVSPRWARSYACESDGDCHLIVVAKHECRLYEMWRADKRGDAFSGGCLAVWDLDRDYPETGRGDFCTSATPFYFSVALPEGNYKVTVTFGDRTDLAEALIGGDRNGDRHHSCAENGKISNVLIP